MSPARPAASIAKPAAAPRAPRTAGRGWSVGRSSAGGIPASCPRHQASSASSRSPDKPPALPGGVVRVLDRQLRQRARGALPEGGVERRQLARQHPDRPAVARDVVQRHQRDVLLRRQGQQRRPQQRAPPPDRTAAAPPPPPAAPPPPGAPRPGAPRGRRPAGRSAARRARPPPPARPPRSGTWCAAPRDGARSRPGPRRTRPRSSAPAEPDRRRQVVHRAPRLELVEEPQPRLSERQRRPSSAGTARGSIPDRLARRAAADLPLDPCRELRHRRRLEHRPHRQLHAEHGAHPRRHLRRQQRMAAQLEEAVRAPTRSCPSTSAKIPATSSSAGVRGASAPSDVHGLQRQRRERPAVHLAVGGQRQRLQHAPGRRHHVGRQDRDAGPPTSSAAEPLPATAPPRPPAAGSPRVRPRQHHRRAHSGQRQQARLDLPQLDAEAPHLDLVIEPAQELQLPVRTAGAPGRPCGTAARLAPDRRAPNGSGTKRSAVSSGRPR